MAHHDDKVKASKKFAELVSKFGETVGEILDDPELRVKAREFAMSVVDASAKVVSTKIKNNDVKTKFHSVGKAAQSFGKSLEDNFKAEES